MTIQTQRWLIRKYNTCFTPGTQAQPSTTGWRIGLANTANRKVVNFVDTNVNTGSDTINVTAHGLQTGVRGRLTTTGVLPTPLATATASTTFDAATVNTTTDRITVVNGAVFKYGEPVVLSGGTLPTSTPTLGGGAVAYVKIIDPNVNTFELYTDPRLTTKYDLTAAGSGTVTIRALDLYAIRVDADNFRLALSLDAALAGTAIDITAAAGGGTHTFTQWDHCSPRDGIGHLVAMELPATNGYARATVTPEAAAWNQLRNRAEPPAINGGFAPSGGAFTVTHPFLLADANSTVGNTTGDLVGFNIFSVTIPDLSTVNLGFLFSEVLAASNTIGIV